MSTPTNGFVVTLASGVGEEERDRIVAGLRAIRGVVEVEPIGDDIGTMLAKAQVRREIAQQFYEFYTSVVRGK